MEIVTSQLSPIRIIEVVPENDAGGWISISLAPGKKAIGTDVMWDRDLETDLDRLKGLGVTTLVPFLEDDELECLRIPNLVEAAKARGMDVRRYAFHDAGIPKDVNGTVQFVEELLRRYAKGERSLMHCRGGLGRAGTMAACVRLALGLDMSPGAAIHKVRELRSPRAIETRGQEAFVGRFLQAWKAHHGTSDTRR